MKTIKGNQGKPQKAKPAASTNPAIPKSQHLQVAVTPERSRDSMMADVMTDGIAANASTAIRFAHANFGELSLTEMVRSLREQGGEVNRGDFGSSERMLTAQANTLNVIFAEMARRAALNMGEYLGATETYLRLALKAQGQCRATLETLAAIKNPPVVFAKQANIAHGHQQVNNGLNGHLDQYARTGAHAGKTDSEQTKLLEDGRDGCTYLEPGATPAATRGNPALEAVGAVNRPKEPRRQSARKP